MMGEHKYNLNCQLAKEGKLPPKPKGISKRAQRRQLMQMVYEMSGLGTFERAVGLNSFKEADEMADLLKGR